MYVKNLQRKMIRLFLLTPFICIMLLIGCGWNDDMLREKQGGSDSSMIMEGQENQGQTGEGQENQGQTGEGHENQGQNGEGEEAQGQEGQTAEGSSDEIRYMDNFVSLNDFLPDAIIELRYYTSYNFVGERIDGYEEPVALLTREAAQALRHSPQGDHLYFVMVNCHGILRFSFPAHRPFLFLFLKREMASADATPRQSSRWQVCPCSWQA